MRSRADDLCNSFDLDFVHDAILRLHQYNFALASQHSQLTAHVLKPEMRMTTSAWLSAEDVNRDTRHLVEVSAIQIKEKLVRCKLGKGSRQSYLLLRHFSPKSLTLVAIYQLSMWTKPSGEIP